MAYAPAPSSSAQVGMPPEREVTQRVIYLGEAISRLDMSLTMLAERLSPVTPQATEANVQNVSSPRAVDKTKLGGRLAELVDMVERLDRRVAYMCDSVEL